MSSKQKINITESLQELKNILQWFQNQDELDVEKGLRKLKQTAPLIKQLKKRLSEAENEFQQIKKELTEEEVN